MGNSACTQVCKDTDKDGANGSVVLDANQEEDYHNQSYTSLAGAGGMASPGPGSPGTDKLVAEGALIEISRTLEDGSR